MFFLSFTLPLLSAVFVAGRDVLTARQSSNAAGNQQCSRFMCVTATANDTTIQYALSTTGSRTPGWMAIGFGRSMLNSPMVIMWANDDGTITLSQREASAYSMPQVVSSPDRVATLSESLSSTADSSMTFTFTVDAGTSTASTENIIYAFGITNPGSSNEGAALQQHLDYGSWEINLSVPLDASATTVSAPPQSTSTTTGSGSGSGGNPTDDIPLQPYQRLIVAHAVFCVVGFLFFLPFGSLLARYLRTFSPKWFTGHWISQFALAGTTIIIGFALGVQSVTEAKALHLDSTHKKWGVAIFVLYFAQCGIGAVIHWLKPKNSTRRPMQNYFHAVLGLLIIALAFYQVRTGYKTEWPNTTGRGDVSNGIDIVWYIWVVLIPVLYFVGLSFIPKQYRQEAESRKGGWAGNGQYSESVDHINMSHVRQDRFPG